MHEPSLFLGVDFGTDSVRVAAFDSRGEAFGEEVVEYPRWADGLFCDPRTEQYRQHPRDYLEAFESATKQLVRRLGKAGAERIRALAIDTTGSTPTPVDNSGRPLALLEDFGEDANAMFYLWKDHSAVAEADRINHVAHSGRHADATAYCGGAYSAEWFWAKMLHARRRSEPVRKHAASWVEHCDWFTGELVGRKTPDILMRSRCAAGHKAMWRQAGGLPSEVFLCDVDPLLKGVRGQLFEDTSVVGEVAGQLSKAWSERLGLFDVVVGAGALDAHLAAVGGGARPHALIKAIGTSTCDMIAVDPAEICAEDGSERVITGISGQAADSILPGTIGLEAGQAAFGDVYRWFAQLLNWPGGDAGSHGERSVSHLLQQLGEAASALEIDPEGPVALDWFNGRRSPQADLSARATVVGLSLGVDAPRLYRTLVEATVFGAAAIVDHLVEQKIRIDAVVAVGGVANKSPFIMQLLADVLDRPVEVSGATQAAALGAAMTAAVAAGEFATLQDAQAAMQSRAAAIFAPRPAAAEQYGRLYLRYQELAVCRA